LDPQARRRAHTTGRFPRWWIEAACRVGSKDPRVAEEDPEGWRVLGEALVAHSRWVAMSANQMKRLKLMSRRKLTLPPTLKQKVHLCPMPSPTATLSRGTPD